MFTGGCGTIVTFRLLIAPRLKDSRMEKLPAKNSILATIGMRCGTHSLTVRSAEKMPNVYAQLRAEQVADRLGISLSTFNRLIKTETSFPKPIKYSSRWVAWFELEVNDWILRKAAEQRGVEPEVLLSHLREIAPQSEQQSEQFNQIGAA